MHFTVLFLVISCRVDNKCAIILPACIKANYSESNRMREIAHRSVNIPNGAFISANHSASLIVDAGKSMWASWCIFVWAVKTPVVYDPNEQVLQKYLLPPITNHTHTCTHSSIRALSVVKDPTRASWFEPHSWSQTTSWSVRLCVYVHASCVCLFKHT